MAKCKECKQTKEDPMRPTCYRYECKIKYANKHVAKQRKTKDLAYKRETKRLKDSIKTKVMWLKEAQAAFNAFIRYRDRDEPCISCRRHHTGQYHAGHYKSVGSSPELRFNEDNCHKQCAPCNNHLSGNCIEYRIHLIKKIGLDRLLEIELYSGPAKYTADDIKAIKQEYKDKLKELKKS